MRRFLSTACIITASICVMPVVSFAQSSPTAQSGAGIEQPSAPTGKQATTPGTQKKLTLQQKKMKDCSHEAKAKGYKGDQRKQFMSACLKSD